MFDFTNQESLAVNASLKKHFANIFCAGIFFSQIAKKTLIYFRQAHLSFSESPKTLNKTVWGSEKKEGRLAEKLPVKKL